MKKLIGHHTRLRESDDLFLSRAKLHRKKPPFCLCARVRARELRVKFCAVRMRNAIQGNDLKEAPSTPKVVMCVFRHNETIFRVTISTLKPSFFFLQPFLFNFQVRKIHCEEHFSLISTSAVHTWIISYTSLNLDSLAKTAGFFMN